MAFDRFRQSWSGAGGRYVGYASDYPTDTVSAFTSDPIHNYAINPNQPNIYGQKGALSESPPVTIQSDVEYYDSTPGTHGWLLDDIDLPGWNDDPGVRTQQQNVGPAQYRAPDPFHQHDIIQGQAPMGHALDFYGSHIDTIDLPPRMSSNTQAPQTGAFPAQAREDTRNWPVPFDSFTVAPEMPVVRSTDHIPMRRMDQDNTPLYRQLAASAPNITPSGSVFTPTYNSNDYVYNTTPIPAAAQTPIDPWASQDYISAQAFNTDDSESIIGGGWQ